MADDEVDCRAWIGALGREAADRFEAGLGPIGALEAALPRGGGGGGAP